MGTRLRVQSNGARGRLPPSAGLGRAPGNKVVEGVLFPLDDDQEDSRADRRQSALRIPGNTLPTAQAFERSDGGHESELSYTIN